MGQLSFVIKCIIVCCLLLIANDRYVLAQQHKANLAFSQESNGAPGIFLRMGVGARALAMGGAFTALANDVSASYWNPAGLDYVNHYQFEFMNVNMPYDRNFNYIGAAIPVKRLFTLGVSWYGFRVTGLEGRSGNSEQPDYFFGNAQDALILSFAKSINRHVAIGGNLKYIRNDLDQDVASGVGFDASALLRVTDWLSLGAIAQDLGTDYRWQSGLTEGIPMTLRGGAAIEAHEGVVLTADIIKISGLSPTLSLGTEIRPVEMIPLRFGFQDNQFTGGAGFTLPLSNHVLELNYGYASDPLLNDDIHRVSLLLSFGKRSKPGHRRPGNIYSATKSRATGSDIAKPKRGETQAVVTAKLLNVRSGPGTKFLKIAQVKKSQRFLLLDKSGEWRKIRLYGGRVGWVHQRYVLVLKD